MWESRSTEQLRQKWHWPDLWSWACYRQLGEFSPIYHLPVDFSIVVHVGLTSKSLSNGIKLLLNSEPFLKITLRGLGYIDSHTSLNIWYILAEYWSMIGNYAISNRHVAGSIKFMHNNWSPIMIILFLQRPFGTLFTLVSPHECVSHDVILTTTWRTPIARHSSVRTWRALIAFHSLVRHNRALIVRQSLVRHSTH